MIIFYTWYIHFYYYHWIDDSAGGQLVSEGIIRPVVGVSPLNSAEINNDI